MQCTTEIRLPLKNRHQKAQNPMNAANASLNDHPSKQPCRHPRRFFSLIEVIIVMMIISMVTAMMGYHYQSALNQARRFKVEQAKQQINHIITDNLSKLNHDESQIDQLIKENWQDWVKQSWITGGHDERVNHLIHDPWGKPYLVSYDQQKGEIVVKSTHRQYRKR